MIKVALVGAALNAGHVAAPICGLIGLAVGTLIVFAMPRLAAYRLQEPPPDPPAAVLLPLIGGYVGGWRVLWSLVWELLTAGLFFVLGLEFSVGPHLVVVCGYTALLLAVATVDIQHRLILNRLSYPGVVLALIGSLFWPGGEGVLMALIGGLSGLVLFLVIERLGRGAMGPGDTKLAAMIGTMVGFPNVFNALLAGVLLGGLGGLFYLVVLRRGRKEKFAYGPYLVAGAILTLLQITST